MNFHKLYRYLLLIVLATLGIGCASIVSTIPEGYEGPTATLNDTFEHLSRSKGNFYFLAATEQGNVNNALSATYGASQGQGNKLSPMGAIRPLPTTPQKLTLVGQLHHAAPIGYMVNSDSNHRVEGVIEFTPKINES